MTKHPARSICLLLLVGLWLPACEDPAAEPELKRFYTCGDPVCSGHRPQPGVPACSSERAGDSCAREGESCDPLDACNRLVVCAGDDPARMCPISRGSAKRNVQYLSDADRARLHDELLRFPLATYQYRSAGAAAAPHLGFLVDDVAPSPAVQGLRGDRVDLYGYATMAVAALQDQAQQIAELRQEVDSLRRELERQSARDRSPGITPPAPR